MLAIPRSLDHQGGGHCPPPLIASNLSHLGSQLLSHWEAKMTSFLSSIVHRWGFKLYLTFLLQVEGRCVPSWPRASRLVQARVFPVPQRCSGTFDLKPVCLVQVCIVWGAPSAGLMHCPFRCHQYPFSSLQNVMTIGPVYLLFSRIPRPILIIVIVMDHPKLARWSKLSRFFLDLFLTISLSVRGCLLHPLHQLCKSRAVMTCMPLGSSKRSISVGEANQLRMAWSLFVTQQSAIRPWFLKICGYRHCVCKTYRKLFGVM